MYQQTTINLGIKWVGRTRQHSFSSLKSRYFRNYCQSLERNLLWRIGIRIIRANFRIILSNIPWPVIHCNYLLFQVELTSLFLIHSIHFIIFKNIFLLVSCLEETARGMSSDLANSCYWLLTVAPALLRSLTAQLWSHTRSQRRLMVDPDHNMFAQHSRKEKHFTRILLEFVPFKTKLLQKHQKP